MALFSRRGKSDDSPSEPDAELTAPDTSADDVGTAAPDAEPVPHVGISVSTFGKAPEKPAPPLVVEIGSGTGDVLLDAARRHPDTAYLGIEVYLPGVATTLTAGKATICWWARSSRATPAAC